MVRRRSTVQVPPNGLKNLLAPLEWRLPRKPRFAAPSFMQTAVAGRNSISLLLLSVTA